MPSNEQQAGHFGALPHSSYGLVLRLRSIADDECADDEWQAGVLRQSADEIERLRAALIEARASFLSLQTVFGEPIMRKWAAVKRINAALGGDSSMVPKP
jgi:hypothetical protein